MTQRRKRENTIFLFYFIKGTLLCIQVFIFKIPRLLLHFRNDTQKSLKLFSLKWKQNGKQFSYLNFFFYFNAQKNFQFNFSRNRFPIDFRFLHETGQS